MGRACFVHTWCEVCQTVTTFSLKVYSLKSSSSWPWICFHTKAYAFLYQFVLCGKNLSQGFLEMPIHPLYSVDNLHVTHPLEHQRFWFQPPGGSQGGSISIVVEDNDWRIQSSQWEVSLQLISLLTTRSLSWNQILHEVVTMYWESSQLTEVNWIQEFDWWDSLRTLCILCLITFKTKHL